MKIYDEKLNIFGEKKNEREEQMKECKDKLRDE
jgi:hypothetical protein